jgi:hypothetical protein
MHMQLWTDEDIDILRRGVEDEVPLKEIALKLERTTHATYEKAVALGFVGPLSEAQVSAIRERCALLLPGMKAAIREAVLQSGLTI